MPDQTIQVEKEQRLNVQLLHNFKKKVIVNVNCGRNHAAIISRKGELYMIGSNEQCQLGIGNQDPTKDYKTFYEEPILLTSLFYKGLIVDNVACGFSHTLISTKNGKIFSWGYGQFGALGHGTFESKNEPFENQFFNSKYQSSQEI